MIDRITMSHSQAFIPYIVPVAAGALCALGCLIGAFLFLRRKRLLDDLPTSRARGVFIGLNELKGTAESEAPLQSYLNGTLCVTYKWQVQEHWSRLVTETSSDSRGHVHTRTRTESGWTTVAGGGEAVPFYLKDESGVVRIVPDKAAVHDKEVFERTCGRSDALYYDKGPANAVANSDHRRRFRETAIPLHAELYVVGQARERQDVVAAEIAYDESAPLFIISMKTEKRITAGYGIGFWSLAALGLIFAVAGIFVANHLAGGGPSFSPLTGAAVYTAACIIGWLWTVYNSLICLRQRVLQAWSLVDVQLKRRNDLIPNLVRAIEAYRIHEAEVQQNLAQMRSQLGATPPGTPGADFTALAARLTVIAEKYPELKASDLFIQLQRTLSDTEERIALARDYYNNIATFYNNRLALIPDRLAALLAGLRAKQLLDATGGFRRAPVNVTLAG